MIDRNENVENIRGFGTLRHSKPIQTSKNFLKSYQNQSKIIQTYASQPDVVSSIRHAKSFQIEEG